MSRDHSSSSFGHVRFAMAFGLVSPHAFPALTVLLSVNAGYLDTASFLGLHGLFTAHVTGNLVTLGASVVLGKCGVVAKLVALPVFCCVVALVRLAALWLAEHEWRQLRVLLSIECLLLFVVFTLAVTLGPFPNADAWPAVLTGAMAVAAMAVQNAAHRLHLNGAPPSTLMTGNLTQVMIDGVNLLCEPEARADVRARMLRILTMIASFASGCGLAVLLFLVIGTWCFAAPALFGLLAVIVHTGIEERGQYCGCLHDGGTVQSLIPCPIPLSQC